MFIVYPDKGLGYWGS